MPMQPKDLRIVPNSMSTQMHMFGTLYGVTDDLNVMIMGNYTHKDMTMTTYNMMGNAIGKRTNSTEGFGDLQVSALYRVYEDSINHIHLNFGLSLPTGSTTEQMTMLSPMGKARLCWTSRPRANSGSRRCPSHRSRCRCLSWD